MIAYALPIVFSDRATSADRDAPASVAYIAST